MIDNLSVVELNHVYDTRGTALKSINISARRGEMICIIGPSGCGKSTLIRALAGHLQPTSGHILINGQDLYANLAAIQHYVSYIPQEDTFDPLLSVEENINFASAIRCPHMHLDQRKKHADSILVELGLSECRQRLAGNARNNLLSGGERKRLNTGLDMLSIAEVFLFDEPTSGLSSKDSEHVMEIIRDLSQHKISFVSIHQPSSRLFNLFDKALLLDKGGKVAFFGPPQEMLAYFHDAHSGDANLSPIRADQTETDAIPRQPDFIFDVMEAPLRDSNDKIVYEQDAQGHFTAARRFPPDFWAERFQTYLTIRAKTVRPSDHSEQRKPLHQTLPLPPKRGYKESLLHFKTHFKRAFLSKLRNRANLITTLLAAPALACLIGTTLRYADAEQYTFGQAPHIPTYLFLTLVVALFLGLTNSADDIIRDRGMLARERGHGIRVRQYITGKFITLGAFAFIQCIIYLAIGNAILEVREMFWPYLGWMLFTSLSGIAIGLFISSIARDSKTALNLIPLVLIPQIILGGALIKYEEMNHSLHTVLNIPRWFSGKQPSHPELKKSTVPLISELMPLRWAYESLVITQDELNPLAKVLSTIKAKQKALLDKPDNNKDGLADLGPAELELLDKLKEAQAIAFTLEAENYRSLKAQLFSLETGLNIGKFNLETLEHNNTNGIISTIGAYQNQGIRDLVTLAEIETEDYRIYEQNPSQEKPNVFFGKSKIYFGREMSTLLANLLVMLSFIALFLSALAVNLKRQLKRV